MPSLWDCAFLKWAEALKVVPGMSAETRLSGLGRGKGVVKVSCDDIAGGVLSVCWKRLKHVMPVILLCSTLNNALAQAWLESH